LYSYQWCWLIHNIHRSEQRQYLQNKFFWFGWSEGRLHYVSEWWKWLWHGRLGHANWRLISKLSKMKLVTWLPELQYHSDAFRGTCQRGKIVKTNFKPKNLVSTSRHFELLCIDLFGLVKTAQINGKKYGLVIVFGKIY
jgi:hypothetical protein